MPDAVTPLMRKNAALRARIAELEAENAELRAALGVSRVRVAVLENALNQPAEGCGTQLEDCAD